jgi:hypothetical protein
MFFEKIIADDNLGLRSAFVYVVEGAAPSPQPPLEPVLLFQEGCRYEPHVLGIQAGQPLIVRNLDPCLHSAHVLPLVNPIFGAGMALGSRDSRFLFRLNEVMIRVGCNVHPWMDAWIGVLDHPHFAVTDEAGAYLLPDLPVGRYTLAVWHEAYATVERAIVLGPGDDLAVDFVLDERK